MILIVSLSFTSHLALFCKNRSIFGILLHFISVIRASFPISLSMYNALLSYYIPLYLPTHLIFRTFDRVYILYYIFHDVNAVECVISNEILVKKKISARLEALFGDWRICFFILH